MCFPYHQSHKQGDPYLFFQLLKFTSIHGSAFLSIQLCEYCALLSHNSMQYTVCCCSQLQKEDSYHHLLQYSLKECGSMKIILSSLELNTNTMSFDGRQQNYLMYLDRLSKRIISKGQTKFVKLIFLG